MLMSRPGKQNGRYTHGECHGEMSAEYRAWHEIRSRCMCKTNKKYPRYGGRGIKVCQRWDCVENFIADMGRKPSPKHSIERLNNDGNYEPENCVWALPLQQARNKSNNHRLTFRGETMPLSAWAEKLGIGYSTVRGRARKGWSAEEILTRPIRRRAA